MLVGLGLVTFVAGWVTPLADATWIVGLWPLALVLVGGWLVFRDRLPPAARRPIAFGGALGLLLYAAVAASSLVATGGTRVNLASFGASPITDTVVRDATLASGQRLSIDNPNGKIVVRTGGDGTVHVVATRHLAVGGQPPEIRLQPSDGGGLALSSRSPGFHLPFFFGGDGSSSVDYAVEVPVGAPLRLRTGNGDLDLTGLGGPIDAETGSGSIVLSTLGGDVRAHTGSGSIRGTQLTHARDLATGSGSIVLSGVFAEAATVRTARAR